MKKYFGTDGIRGKVNQKLTAQLALSLGLAIGKIFSNNDTHKLAVIGRDTRNSGMMLEQALSSGLLSQGFDVISLGVLPTPAVAFLTRHFKADIGVVISASHNPFWDNGIKFFNSEGKKLDDALESKIESSLEKDFSLLNDVSKLGNYEEKHQAKAIYLNYLSQVHLEKKVHHRLVLDTANGALSQIAKDFFKKIGYEVITIGDMPNGVNINLGCGSTYLDQLKEKVLENKADLGFAFDGDADRFLVVDGLGESLDGDELLYLYAKYLKQNKMLSNDMVVATVMSNFGLSKALSNLGISLITTSVGDRYVSEGMRKYQANLGGEQSGHLIFNDYNTTGDGLLSAVMLLNILNTEQKPLHELKQEMKKYPQVLINVEVRSKDNWDKNPRIINEIQLQESTLGGLGRILVRPSGTENLIRVMVEGESSEKIQDIAEKIANVIKAELQ